MYVRPTIAGICVPTRYANDISSKLRLKAVDDFGSKLGPMAKKSMFSNIGTNVYTTNETLSWLDTPFYLCAGKLVAVDPPATGVESSW